MLLSGRTAGRNERQFTAAFGLHHLLPGMCARYSFAGTQSPIDIHACSTRPPVTERHVRALKHLVGYGIMQYCT
jgi:hypothetical protein